LHAHILVATTKQRPVCNKIAYFVRIKKLCYEHWFPPMLYLRRTLVLYIFSETPVNRLLSTCRYGANPLFDRLKQKNG
jgi:hypothetical protein